MDLKADGIKAPLHSTGLPMSLAAARPSGEWTRTRMEGDALPSVNRFVLGRVPGRIRRDCGE
jgi:hypothetical protein